jgi:uncharacterized membrane protein YgcG
MNRRTVKRFFAASVLAGLSTYAIAPGVSRVRAASPNSTARHELNAVLPEVTFNGVALTDSLDFIRDVSGLNLTVNWKALEEAGITRDTPVTLRLRSIPVRKALQMVLSEAGGGDKLTYDMDDGVLEVTTTELADQRMFTKVYPVEDLIMDIPDFTDAPVFDLSSLSQQSQQMGQQAGMGGMGGAGGGGGGQQGGLFGGGSGGSGGSSQKEAPGKTKQERAQDLMDLIRSVVQPEVWQENGGKAAIRYFNGNLIVTAPRSVQEAIGGAVD